MSDSLVNKANCSQKNEQIVFDRFPPFYAQEQRAIRSCRSLQKIILSDLLRPLKTKVQWERFAQDAQDKRAPGASDSLTKNKWITWKTDERIPNPEYTST